MRNMVMVLAVALLLGISSPVFADSLWTLNVGDWYEYNNRDSANPAHVWSERWEVLGKDAIGGQEYMKIGIWDAGGAGSYEELFARSTEDAVYGLNNIVYFKIAPINTTWNYPYSNDDGTSGVQVNKIISIESVTVPYGTFSNASVQQSYFDPDDPGLPNSAYWYDYFVPGVGYVKQIDYVAPYPPDTSELARVGVTPEPVSSALFILGGGAMMAMRGRRRNGRKRRSSN